MCVTHWAFNHKAELLMSNFNVIVRVSPWSRSHPSLSARSPFQQLKQLVYLYFDMKIHILSSGF